MHDAYGSTVRSRLTFLIYLNDDFEGGSTTFYLPSLKEGVLDTHAVQPQVSPRLMRRFSRTGEMKGRCAQPDEMVCVLKLTLSASLIPFW